MPPPSSPEIRSDLEFAISSARAAGERALAIRATGRWSGETLPDVGDQAADGYPLGAVSWRAKGRRVWGVCVPGRESWGIEGSAEGRKTGLGKGDSPSGQPPRIAVSRSHTPAWTQRLADALGAELVHAGSVGNKVGLLLLGEADLYVHRKQLKEWDTCAPEVVARALGWTVCKLRGDEHVYNRSDPMNGELVVCRPTWKERVLGALASAGALEG